MRHGNNTMLFIYVYRFVPFAFFVLQTFRPRLSVKRQRDVSPAVEKSIPEVLSIILPLAQTDFHLRLASYRCA